MQICLIGKLCDESIVWLKNLLSLGYNIQFINTHLKRHKSDYLENKLSIIPYNLYENHSFPYGIKNLIELYLYHNGIKKNRSSHFKRTSEILSDYFKRNKFDLIFAWWGSDVFYELYHIIYSLRLKIAIMHCLNTYPSTPLRIGYGYLEDYFYKLFHDKILGRIFYSKEMKKFYDNKIYSHKNNYITIIEPYLKKCYYAQNKLDCNIYKLIRNDDNPYIVFTGRTDFSNDLRRRKDNVKQELLKIAEMKIHIYLRASEQIKESEFIHYYPDFTTEELCNGIFASYLHQFDASLVIYNEFTVKDRYRNSLSTRFAHSLTAGIPIITRDSSVFAKNIFVKYKNGFTFNNLKELKEILMNKNKMDFFRKNAEMNIETFSFENNENEFRNFIEKTINLL